MNTENKGSQFIFSYWREQKELWQEEQKRREEQERSRREQERARREQERAYRERLDRQRNSREYFLRSTGYIYPDPEGCISSQLLYEQYCRWCRDFGVTPHSPRGLFCYVKHHQAEYGLIPTQNIPTDYGTHVRGFRGIRLLQEGDTDHTDTGKF